METFAERQPSANSALDKTPSRAVPFDWRTAEDYRNPPSQHEDPYRKGQE